MFFNEYFTLIFYYSIIKEVRIFTSYFTILWYCNSDVFQRKWKNHLPHIHVMYNEYNSVYDFNGNRIEGTIPTKQAKLVEAWILLHAEELNSLWNLMKNGEDYFKIEPLK